MMSLWLVGRCGGHGFPAGGGPTGGRSNRRWQRPARGLTSGEGRVGPSQFYDQEIGTQDEIWAIFVLFLFVFFREEWRGG